jgi:ABC-type cobalamin/Fe3+-siderophores transport system ATPase subunit
MQPKAPRLIIFGGANGSGKSTLTQWYRRKLASSSIILDPDAIARDLNPKNPAKAAIKAARIVLKSQQDFLKSGQSFTLETTLSSKGNLELIQHLAQCLTRSDSARRCVLESKSVEHWRPTGVATDSGFHRSESAERPKPVRCCFKGQEARQRI